MVCWPRVGMGSLAGGYRAGGRGALEPVPPGSGALTAWARIALAAAAVVAFGFLFCGCGPDDAERSAGGGIDFTADRALEAEIGTAVQAALC